MAEDTRYDPAETKRLDDDPDEIFYQAPRLVAHIDGPAQTALAGFYQDKLPSGSRILDLMSSYVSHLPVNGNYRHVTGLGLNALEMKSNGRLDTAIVQNLNETPTLPFSANSFDACLIAVSIQYLTSPVDVFRDIARILTPNAPLIVSYSNRMFPTKAIAAWRRRTDWERGKLIQAYFAHSDAYHEVTWHDLSPMPEMSDPLFAVAGYKA